MLKKIQNMLKKTQHRKIKIVQFHDGKNGDLNNNASFLSTLGSFYKNAQEKYEALEYFDCYATVFKFEEKWGLYFTALEGRQPISVNNKIDGYLIESHSLLDMWKYFANVQNLDINAEYTSNLIKATNKHFARFSK